MIWCCYKMVLEYFIYTSPQKVSTLQQTTVDLIVSCEYSCFDLAASVLSAKWVWSVITLPLTAHILFCVQYNCLQEVKSTLLFYFYWSLYVVLGMIIVWANDHVIHNWKLIYHLPWLKYENTHTWHKTQGNGHSCSQKIGILMCGQIVN